MICLRLNADEVTTEEEGNSFLKNAGREALADYEKQLNEKMDKIDDYILSISADRVVTGKEMVELKEMVEDFSKLKREANKRLKIYGLTVDPNFEKEMAVKKDLVSTYFLPILRARDRDGSVRKYFAQLTGHDLTIKSRFNWATFLFLLSLVVLFFLASEMLAAKSLPGGSYLFVGGALLFFLLALFFIGILLFGLLGF